MSATDHGPRAESLFFVRRTKHLLIAGTVVGIVALLPLAQGGEVATAAMTATLALALIAFGIREWRLPSAVFVHEKGFVIASGRGEHFVPWNEVRSIAHERVVLRDAGGHAIESHVPRIHYGANGSVTLAGVEPGSPVRAAVAHIAREAGLSSNAEGTALVPKPS
jgi:hypothetical protein